MVARMMKWRPWPAGMRKFEMKLTLISVSGLPLPQEEDGGGKLRVHIKWKGRRGRIQSKLGGIRRNYTAMQTIGKDGIVQWNETFDHVCELRLIKDDTFVRWLVRFDLIKIIDEEMRSTSVIGSAFLNIGELASLEECPKETTLKIKFSCMYGGTNIEAELMVAVKLLYIQGNEETFDSLQRLLSPLSCIGNFAVTKDESIDDVKRPEKYSSDEEASAFKQSPINEEFDSVDLFDTESTESMSCDAENGDISDIDSSFTYDTIVATNLSAGHVYMDCEESFKGISINGSNIDLLPRLIDESCSSSSDSDLNTQRSVRRLLSWKKKTFSFKSPKEKGEPLLNKSCSEEGGDDIDLCRRQEGSPHDVLYLEYEKKTADALLSAFGDDQFTIGRWEKKDIISRDGQMKLSTEVFFGSIDQRSERAAGESACTALVAVVADWLHANPRIMPNKSQFDMLIREGSQEWRKLCDVDTYQERFPDKHFDLDTIVAAQIRPLSVVHEKSFVGFFNPDLEGDAFDFLKDAMTFDSIWNEITKGDNENDGYVGESQIYIVSWNDHFFILEVQRDVVYLIDTLGERLFEGCKQAYIVKFDKDTEIYQLPQKDKMKDQKSVSSSSSQAAKPLSKVKYSTSALSKELKVVVANESKVSSVETSKTLQTNYIEGSKSPKLEGSKSPSLEGSKSPKSESSKSPRLGSFWFPLMDGSKSPKLEGSMSPKVESLKLIPKSSFLSRWTSKSEGSISPKLEISTTPKSQDCLSPSIEDSGSTEMEEAQIIEKDALILTEITGKNSDDEKEKLASKGNDDEKEKLVSKGKDSCKAFIDGFLAALPLRELRTDMEKGLLGATTPLHQRLQIEFHYTSNTRN